MAAIKLLLTKVGQEKMTAFVFNEQKVNLSLVLGSGYQAVNQDIITLKKEEEQAQATLVFSQADQKNIKQLHIQASVSGGKKAYDIREIGLFIVEKEDTKTLLGVFSVEKPLARKTENMDLFLDVVLDLQGYTADQFVISTSDYKSAFAMPMASTEKLGSVQLARPETIAKGRNISELPRVLTTQHLADEQTIKDKKPGFILTTNNLTTLFPQQYYDRQWKKISKQDLGFKWDKSIFSSAVFQENDNSIYIFSAFAIEGEGDKLFYSQYNVENDALVTNKLDDFERKGRIVLPQSFHASEPCVELYSTTNKINWSFSGLQDSLVISYKLAINFSKRDYSLLKKHTQSFKGALFLHNDELASLADSDDYTQEILIGESYKAKCLISPRKKPLVHRVQDRIYCFAGATAAEEPLVEIVSIFAKSGEYTVSSFAPSRNANHFNLLDTSNLVSCVLGVWIYIFDTGQSVFYRYHTLDNRWQILAISRDLQNYLNNIKLKKSLLTVVRDVLYLFVFQTDKLAIFKFVHSV